MGRVGVNVWMRGGLRGLGERSRSREHVHGRWGGGDILTTKIKEEVLGNGVGEEGGGRRIIMEAQFHNAVVRTVGGAYIFTDAMNRL